MRKIDIDKIDLEELEIIIQKKICEYINKYLDKPKYVKIPLWLFNCLKREIGNIIKFNIDYETEKFKYMGLIVCETVTIKKAEEIEVF